MSTAIVDVDGNVRQLDARADVPVVVSADEVKDAEKLARLLNDARREIAYLRRRRDQRQLIFKAYTATAGSELRLEHGFGGEALYTVKSWAPVTPGDAPIFDLSDDSDDSTLVLEVGNSGVVTMLVEETG